MLIARRSLLKSNREYFNHILSEVEFLEKYASLSKETFLNDPALKRAFVRSIEIIGEAVKKVAPELKQKYAKIEWRNIAGARDKLIHAYFVVDYEIVWDIAKVKIPVLKAQILSILENEPYLF
jgi:uncharacterized protein with HEPN domain